MPALGAELTPGTYFSNEPGLEVMFTVGPGWVHQQSGVAFFDIERNPGSPDVIAIQFAAVTLDQAQSDLAGQIQASDQLIVSPPAEIELDCHLDATRLVVEPRAPANTDPPTFVPVVNVVAGPLSIATGRRLQLDIFTFHMGGAIIMVGGSIAHWDETLAAAAPVLDSVKLRPDGAVCE